MLLPQMLHTIPRLMMLSPTSIRPSTRRRSIFLLLRHVAMPRHRDVQFTKKKKKKSVAVCRYVHAPYRFLRRCCFPAPIVPSSKRSGAAGERESSSHILRTL